MIETILKLLERFVVAHELIAANSAKTTLIEKVGDVVRAVEGSGESEAVKSEVKANKAKPEDDLDDEPEAKPARKPRQTKEKKTEVDLALLREEISLMAQKSGGSEFDDCIDDFEDLMDEYDIHSVKKVPDDEVVKFHAALKAIVEKYYDIED